MSTRDRVARARMLARKLRERRPLLLSKATRFYSRELPSPATAASIFRGEWASRLPPPLDTVTGRAPQFEDPSLRWAIEQFGDLAAARVLELGPLEAGHSYMLHRAGAHAITAVEGNWRAFLRCLIVKELFGLDRASFLHGDFLEYLRAERGQFDLCVASGVLYHMLNPVELLSLIAAVAPRLYLWTMYHDPAAARRGRLRRRMGRPVSASFAGYDHILQPHSYGYSLRRFGFCGGSNPTANWLSRENLLDALRHVGYTGLSIGFEDRAHPNGAAIAIYAVRQSPSWRLAPQRRAAASGR